jgi:hypothetical protein
MSGQIYVLIAFLSGYSGNGSAITAEFNNLSACEYAIEELERVTTSESNYHSVSYAVCLPKGENE